MAGHSKWANIKHRKGAQDQKRAKEFQKVIKEITIAIKENNLNGDPETNPALRTAITNAKGVNMPKDNIDRAIKKATGEGGDSYERVTFEGYAPHGIAFFVECQTDNTNRTVAAVRSLFSKNGGSLGVNGSVEFLFERKGVFTLEKEKLTGDNEAFELELIEGGAESIDKDDDEFLTVYTAYDDFGLMQQKLDSLTIEPKNAGLQYIPLTTLALSTEEGVQVLKLLEKFEDEDDVQEVYHNLEITDEMMESFENGE
ncbi:YebC/PmpR family DNA-binding transcriptional regulator [Flavobacteriaceae bacterium Ap0902]|nr:YebC/PmpR family DNA-binding transcriptional regulator [Flavobacteriaceae bacterium Ap0902]